MSSYTVPFVAGNTPGADHTQFGTLPFSERPTGLFESLFPIGFTLEEIMLLCWRVRKWEVNGSASWTFTPSVGDPSSDSVDYSPAAQDPQPYLTYDSEENYGRQKIRR